jgi:hypothetical protein
MPLARISSITLSVAARFPVVSPQRWVNVTAMVWHAIGVPIVIAGALAALRAASASALVEFGASAGAGALCREPLP